MEDGASLPVPDLPKGVIKSILSKSDVKSVVRSKSVSKSWESIISDPRFPRTHLLRRSLLPENQNKNLLLATPKNHEPDMCIYLLKFQAGKFLTESVFPYKSKHLVILPLCSCDGLVLLAHADNHTYMLWNPSIGKTITIGAANPHTTIPSFYYDSVADDYKIVFVYEDASYAVYSCKDRIWSETRDLPCERSVLFYGETVDGCFYGLCGVDENEILCFDAREGRSGMLRQPEGVKGLIEVEVKVISGRLCLYGLSSDRQRLQMWVMEKSGRGFDCSWRKVGVMEKPVGDIFRPLFLSNEDEVVMLLWEEKGEKHLIYNPREKRLREIELDWVFGYRFFPYWENLYMPCSNVEVEVEVEM